MNEMTLREYRIKLGMTMDEMAEVINVPKSSYSYWESVITLVIIQAMKTKCHRISVVRQWISMMTDCRFRSK